MPNHREELIASIFILVLLVLVGLGLTYLAYNMPGHGYLIFDPHEWAVRQSMGET